MILAGIDEAGYGPILGPLVVALAGFPVDAPETSGHDVWKRLDAAVSRTPTRDGRIAVCDSKRLFQRGRTKHPLAALETSALAFVVWKRGALPRTLTEYLAALGARFAPPPIYADELLRLELPLAADARSIEEAAQRLRDAGARNGVGSPVCELRVLTEDEYNAGCDRLGSKARLLFEANVELLLRARGSAGSPLVVCCDRHGGRSRYRDLLAASFPLEPISRIAELEGASRYRVGVGEDRIELDYRVGGEDASLPTALASIFAKYTRELFMTVFNRYFATRAPTIPPTAGYWTDGLRYLDDLTARGALEAAERVALVRRR